MENDESRFKRIKVPPRGALLRTVTNNFRHKELVVVGTELYGYEAHWTGNGCRFHFADREKCICKDQDMAIRQKFFLQVMEGLNGSEWMLELTPEGSRMFEETAKQLETVRGQIIKVYRRGLTKQTPLMVEFMGRYVGQFDLPLPKDLLPSVKRLWKIE